MGKKKSKKKNTEKFDFKLLLSSMTVAKIRELIDYYNEEYVVNGPKEEFLKGYSILKKAELVVFLDSSLTESEKNELYKKYEPEIIKTIITNALALVSGEHKAEQIHNAAILSGGKGYRIWFKGKYGSTKASLEISNSTTKKSCTCRIGEKMGICIHEMAIYLMLLIKKAITLEEIPFNIDDRWFETIQKRLDLLATQSIFKEEPAIKFSNDYSIYINNDLVTYQWGGDYAGKATKDISQIVL